MEQGIPQVRRLPLRIAGTIGLFSAVFYLAIIVGEEDTSLLPQAIFWLILMTTAGILAWSADHSVERGRAMAMGAAAIFFILGLLALEIFVIVFLVALVFSVLGFAGMGQASQGESADS